MKWDALSGTSYVLNSLQFSIRLCFYRRFNIIDLSYCYVNCVGDRHPFVICQYIGLEKIIKKCKNALAK